MSLSPSGSTKRANYTVQTATCVVDGCTADLSNCRKYHQRHKVCEVHSKSPEVSIKGQKLRFCQQCSRFHPLDEFDDGKRSCRKRLDGHNRRRRKPRPYIFSGHHVTGMLQPSGPPAHPTMALASHVWSQSNHAPSLLSSSEASCTTLNHLVHPSSSSFSITGNQLDSGLSYGGLENDSDAGWGGTIDRSPHEDPRTFPFYWQYS